MLRNYGLLGIGATDSQFTNDCIEQNMGHDGKITSQLQDPEALDRYQEQLLRSRRPEKHIQQDDEDGEAITVGMSRYRMNLMQHGNDLGDVQAAYKPEIVNDPVPWRLKEEKQDKLFEKSKKIDRMYVGSTIRQRDDILQFPEYERGYKYSDAQKYIPGEIRTMEKITMDTHVLPIYAKPKQKKVQHNFKNQINDIDETQFDPTMIISKTIKKKLSTVLEREKVEQIPVETNVNEMCGIVARKKKTLARLPQDIDRLPDDTETKERGWQRTKPKKMGFVNPGIVTDSKSYLELAETVQNIESKVRRNKNSANLSFRTVVASAIPEEVSIFKKKREKNVKRGGHIPDIRWEDVQDEDGVVNVSKIERHTNRYSNILTTKIRREDVTPDLTSITDRFKKKSKPILGQTRSFAVEVFDDDTSTQERFRLSGPDKKGNLAYAVTGYDLSDTSGVEDDIQKRKHNPKSGIIGMVDPISDMDETRNINVHREKSKRTRVSRKMPTGTVSVNTDPYNRSKKSSMHPSEIKKSVRRGNKNDEFSRAKIDILGGGRGSF